MILRRGNRKVKRAGLSPPEKMFNLSVTNGSRRAKFYFHCQFFNPARTGNSYLTKLYLPFGPSQASADHLCANETLLDTHSWSTR